MSTVSKHTLTHAVDRLTWCEASCISRITALLSVLSGQDTTMNPAKRRSHSSTSRLSSLTCTQREGLLQRSAFHSGVTGEYVPADGSGDPSLCIPARELSLPHVTSLGAPRHSWLDTHRTEQTTISSETIYDQQQQSTVNAQNGSNE